MSEDLHDLFARVHGVITGPGERDAKLQAICDLLRENVDHYDRVEFILGEPGAAARGRTGLPITRNGEIAGELVIDSRGMQPLTEEERQFLEGICTFVSGIL
jgi:GAF domain-containing protein